MKIVCPYIEGMLQPATVRALTQFAPSPTYHRLNPQDVTAYWHLIDELWAAGEEFLLVEHDIEIHAGVIPGLAACDEPWCTFPYLGGGDSLLDQALGCTRFSAELLAAEPDMFAATGDVTDGIPFKDWRRVDSILLSGLRTAGYAPHVHQPSVTHHHPY